MNRHKIFALTTLALALFLSALQLDGAALAGPPIQSVTFSYAWVNTLDAGRVWVDRDGMHIRDRVEVGALAGDVEGTARVVYNADLSPYFLDGSNQSSPPPGSGSAYGTIQIFSSNLDQAALSWNGDWNYLLQDGIVVSGALTAFSQDGQRILLVDTVSENENGAIVHSGFIDYLFCPDSKCGGPPTN